VTDLISRTPCKGLLPLEIWGLVLREVDPGKMTSIMPFRGQEIRVADLLKSKHHADLPAPNRSCGKPGQQVIWFARGQVLLIGPVPDPALAGHAALTDQSDAWAVVKLEGAKSEDVLARLVPIDLRLPAFAAGDTARTQLQHLHASITRLDATTFQIMAFRSMAATLVHDLRSAMEAVAARG
jgi:heterotetrameric sarcosine oxidase gamma subunit